MCTLYTKSLAESAEATDEMVNRSTTTSISEILKILEERIYYLLSLTINL